MAPIPISSYPEEVSELWLVRRTDNQIIGPLPREELSARILAGEFQEDDEFCSGKGYWIFLHEAAEIRKWLGIEPPKRGSMATDDDTTDTGRLSLSRDSATDPEATDRFSNAALRGDGGSPPLEDTATQVISIQSLEEHTRKRGWNLPVQKASAAAATGGAARSGNAAPVGRPTSNPKPVPPRRKLPVPQVERPSFFRGFAWALAVGILVVIYALLRVLRTAA